MKALSFLAPIVGIFKHIGFLYRIIGIVACFAFFGSNAKDLMYLSTANETVGMTVEDLMALPKDEIPRYLKLVDLSILDGSYVATQNEDTGEILDATYPVYSIEQISNLDSTNYMNVEAHVVVKDKDFYEESLTTQMDVDGMFDNSGFAEVKNILTGGGVKVSDNAVLIVKEKPPSYSSSLIWTLVTGIGGLLLALSFLPNSMYGIVEEPEEEPQA